MPLFSIIASGVAISTGCKPSICDPNTDTCPPNTCKSKTSDLLLSLSLIGIIELLLFYIPSVIFVFISSILLIYTNNHTYLTYVSLSIIIIYFLFSLAIDSNIIYTYNTQTDRDITTESTLYIVICSLIILYYVSLIVYCWYNIYSIKIFIQNILKKILILGK
jgi:hypothetical protein